MHEWKNVKQQTSLLTKSQCDGERHRNNKNKHKLKKIRRRRKKTNRKDKIEIARTYIKNLSKYSLSDSEILILSKKLNFVPTPAPPRTRELIIDFDDLARRMRSRLWAFENKAKRTSELFTIKKKVQTDTPSDIAVLENYLTATKIELANLHSSRRFNREKMLKNAIQNIHQINNFDAASKETLTPS